MARLCELQLGESVEKPEKAATQMAGDIEVFLGGVLDPHRERIRMEEQRQKVVRQLEASARKLSNEGFVKKAPANVVDVEREREAELKGQLVALERSLEALGRSSELEKPGIL